MYKADSEYECRMNLLNFFEDLYPEDKKFRNYFYGIIKEFSEMHLKMFLESNLVDFMNTISRKRRGNLLIYNSNFSRGIVSIVGWLFLIIEIKNLVNTLIHQKY